MKLTIENYKKNRPLFNSVLFGLFYFLFCWSLDFGDSTEGLFAGFMLFLPGLTFPLSTCYFNIRDIDRKNKELYIIVHLFLSVGIYFGCVWLYSGYYTLNWLPVIAGFVGSLFFQLVTILLLKKKITVKQLILVSVLSGLVFISYVFFPYYANSATSFMGLALFLWTLINGALLNYEYKRATYHQRTVNVVENNFN